MSRAFIIEYVRRLCGHRFPPLGGAVFRSVFRVLPAEVDTELLPGIRAHLDLTDDTQRATYWQGTRFDWPMAAILNNWGNAGATHFFDIGSNYGFFSFFLLSRFDQISVHAFEPNPTTFRSLSTIKTENGLDQLHVWNCGLSDGSSSLPLRRGLSDSGHSTFGPHPGLGASAATTTVVKLVDFETWRKDADIALPRESQWIAKIDVEGFEMKVLHGMRKSFEARAFRGVAVEINPFTLGFCNSRPEEIYSFMHAVGYIPLGQTIAGKQLRMNRTSNEYFIPI